MRNYTEIKKMDNFIDRYHYLKLEGQVGIETFGFDRYLNQTLYKSPEWKRVRREVILRDSNIYGEACDLGIEDHEIPGGIIIVHHMNPITENDIFYNRSYVLDPEYLITTIIKTHNAIHYGDEDLLLLDPIERSPNDMCPWRK